MAEDNMEKPPGSSRYKAGNTRSDGSYVVGRGRPPEGGKFRKGDGRNRGRRKKGTKNFATDLREELNSKITVKVGGEPRQVTRQRALVMRLMDNASRGHTQAIKLIMDYAERLGIAIEPVIDEHEEVLPNLKDLSEDELDLLRKLMAKASGAEFKDPILPEHPLAYLHDPDDPRNYYTECTVEGIHIRHCHIDAIPDEIQRIDSRAYWSAALPRKPGCFRDLK